MSNNNGPKIITDGLILYLDAGNPKSYVGSGTAWNDLSGYGNNGTLTHGPTFDSSNGGSIVFDGADDYVQCTGTFTTSEATFIVWAYRDGTQDIYDGLLLSRGTNVTGMFIASADNQLGYIWNDVPATYTWQSGLIMPNLGWCMCAISANSDSATAYLGQSTGLTAAVNATGNLTTNIDDIKIGQDDDGGRFFKGKIAIAQIYNRALLPNEILENYNAVRTRFGL